MPPVLAMLASTKAIDRGIDFVADTAAM